MCVVSCDNMSSSFVHESDERNKVANVSVKNGCDVKNAVIHFKRLESHFKNNISISYRPSHILFGNTRYEYDKKSEIDVESFFKDTDTLPGLYLLDSDCLIIAIPKYDLLIKFKQSSTSLAILFPTSVLERVVDAIQIH